MESPRKFNDCYFYYYSTCTKGDNCVFRHEPTALGCETMCSAWQQGKCLDKRCKLRHMELRKNRKQIPCYWENQPGGCRKIHCPFMHKNPENRTDGIAPSQPIQAPSGVGSSVNVPEPIPDQPPMNPGVPNAVPAPQPVPLLWQQQRQGTPSWRPTYNLPTQELVLDSAILGVLPGGRVLPPHEAQPNPYVHGPLPVDPLVVNFEEESDNESAPSSTPTKVSSSALKIDQKKSEELKMLEKIQAEAAAYYNYDTLPIVEPKRDRKIVRTNLTAKYERLPSDEGKPTTERRSSLDFKVLSLDEIRARKKTGPIIQNTPITINLSRKRKLTTEETITTSGNKIIKVVRSNSIVYKKLDTSASAVSGQSKTDQKQNDNVNRKRKLSNQSNMYEGQEDELVDNCFEFKRIKLTEPITAKPKLNRNSSTKSNEEQTSTGTYSDKGNDSDSEVQIIGEEKNLVDTVDLSDSDDVPTTTNNIGEPIVVDLSEEDESDEITYSDLDLDLSKNVPDVVASCHQQSNKLDTSEDYIHDIDNLLDDS